MIPARWLINTSLGIFYAVVVCFAIVLLAALQFRLSGGAIYDTWRLNYDANRILYDDLQQKLEQAIIPWRRDSDLLSGAGICLRLYDEGGVLKRQLLDEDTLKQIEEAKLKRTPLDKLVGDIGCVVKGSGQAQYEKSLYQHAVDQEQETVSALKISMEANSTQYADLVKGHQDFLAFKQAEAIPFERLFIVAPYDLLVLMLVVVMGALGGIVRLLRDYGAKDHPSPTNAEYFLIPLIGAVVAIGGYVLAKAGLLLLSTAGSESSLSPFMIGLVGIVSGLLAKEVIDTIALRGRDMLKRDETPNARPPNPAPPSAD
jgi:hypothetical protein